MRSEIDDDLETGVTTTNDSSSDEGSEMEPRRTDESMVVKRKPRLDCFPTPAEQRNSRGENNTRMRVSPTMNEIANHIITLISYA